ncbi:S8 family serine peptidase [Pedobacter metabolipauper]|uniref:Subtilase family protein n=1 Tax=Pedobacter metabolipauper TaxID=425513 RepID=A0A4R6SZ80_9SPHI|nr:S8 family serine peptidase [Pedobacter metabolipauper]TDQ11377.1 subtilase family protein [Pedobacter metabolipauper]
MKFLLNILPKRFRRGEVVKNELLLLKYVPFDTWDEQIAKQKLNELYLSIIELVNKDINWYHLYRAKKGCWSKTIRVTSIILLIGSTLMPYFASLCNSPIAMLYIGYIMAGFGGGLLLLDQYYGFSNSWVRFVLTGMDLENMRNAFLQSWQVLYLSNAPLTIDGFKNMVDALLKFHAAFNGVKRAETESWAKEFQQNLKGLIAALKNQSDQLKTSIEEERIKEKNKEAATTDGSGDQTVVEENRIGDLYYYAGDEKIGLTRNGTSEFKTKDGQTVSVTENLLVKFKPEITPQEIKDYNLGNDVTVVSAMEGRINYYLLKSAGKSAEQIIKLANTYHENEMVEFAQPDFIREYHKYATVNDPMYNAQWALKNTGQNGGTPGEDINIEAAWAITQGSPDIIISIIDTGVDYKHPELDVTLKNGESKLVIGYDALKNDDKQQQPLPGVSHGTSCAGIAAASTNNNKGIAGIAPGCKIMGIRVFKDDEYCASCDSAIANGITWAVDHGADVLSCSWGGIARSSTIIDALDHALNRGRNGKGCVVVFASGNNYGGNSDLQFPADYDAVITVTACDHKGNFKYSGSGDGSGWGSNYGSKVDLCAPGTGIQTLTNLSTGGYDDSFFGTSAAAPMVAATAALMLSVNPSLTRNDVESILRKSARAKEGKPNKKYGYGILNAGEAVKQASSLFAPIV